MIWNDLKQPKTTYNEQGTSWNDLQRAATSKKQLEMTYNDLKIHITNKKRPENNLQRARNDLKRPTTSKTQPTTAWTYLQRAKKKTQNDQQRADFQIILQYRAIGSPLWHVFNPTLGWNHSSIASRRIIVKIECQTFLYYYMYLLRDTKFTGYVANHFDTRKLTFARQKSTLWIKQKKSNLDIDTIFRALKVITW